MTSSGPSRSSGGGGGGGSGGRLTNSSPTTSPPSSTPSSPFASSTPSPRSVAGSPISSSAASSTFSSPSSSSPTSPTPSPRFPHKKFTTSPGHEDSQKREFRFPEKRVMKTPEREKGEELGDLRFPLDVLGIAVLFTSLLLHSCNFMDTRVPRLLLTKYGRWVDPSANNQLALERAVEMSNYQGIRLLLGHPLVEPSLNKKIAQKIMKNRSTEVVPILDLFVNDKRIDFTSWNVFNVGVEHNNTWGVSHLSNLFPSSTLPSNSVDIAARCGWSHMVKILLAHPSLQPSQCSSALLWATRRRQTEIVDLLISDGRADGLAALKYSLKNHAPAYFRMILAWFLFPKLKYFYLGGNFPEEILGHLLTIFLQVI